MKCGIAKREDVKESPTELKRETDRRLKRWHFFLFFKSTAAVLSDKSTWVVFFLFIFIQLLLSCFFFFSFVSDGHILSNVLAWSGAMLFMGRSQKFPFKVNFYGLVYFFALHWDFWPPYIICRPTDVYLCACFFSGSGYCVHFLSVLFEQGLIMEQVHHVPSREKKTLNFYFQISVQSVFIICCFHLHSLTVSALHLNMLPTSMCK